MHAPALALALALALLLLASPLTLVARATSHGHGHAHGAPGPDASTQRARASFSVHFPWATRRRAVPSRTGLEDLYPFCGEWVHNPQPFAGYKRTFLSFSGNAGDLVSVHYTRMRVPRTRDDFPYAIAADVPIAASGQLCFDVQMPAPTVPAAQSGTAPEYGVFLFAARDPATNATAFHCSDVMLVDVVDLAQDYPAMCARNNETLVPMPEEYL